MKKINANKQHTIKSAFKIEGIGIQTNENATVEVLPAPENTGICFERLDTKSPLTKVDCDIVSSTLRCTKMALGNSDVSTIEHLMAALNGLGVDNAIIKINGPEIPILDGSSKPFVEAIKKSGLEEQVAEKKWIELTEPICVKDESIGAEIQILPADSYKISSLIKFDNPALPMQFADLEDISLFDEQISSARTFCFYSEVKPLLSKGLIKGGNADNAIIIMDEDNIDHPSIDKNKLFKNEKVTTQTPLRFENEFARHKLLDVVGDLALVGIPFKGHVVCTKPGHKINNAMAKKLKQVLLGTRDDSYMDKYLTYPSIFTIDDLTRMLPHRYPFLMIDKIVESGETHIIAIKNVTYNEPYFQGHFPSEPVMPGVLVLEAMAQAGGAFVLGGVNDYKKTSTYFLSIDKCKFRQKIKPGDSLIIRMDLIYKNVSRGITQMTGRAYVKNNLCCDALLVAKIIKE